MPVQNWVFRKLQWEENLVIVNIAGWIWDYLGSSVWSHKNNQDSIITALYVQGHSWWRKQMVFSYIATKNKEWSRVPQIYGWWSWWNEEGCARTSKCCCCFPNINLRNWCCSNCWYWLSFGIYFWALWNAKKVTSLLWKVNVWIQSKELPNGIQKWIIW